MSKPSKWPRIAWNKASAKLANKPFEHLFDDPVGECNLDCPRCGFRRREQARQEERDEVCLYVCTDCGEVVTETMPF